MAVSVRKATLWRTEVDNNPGALARTLEPLAEIGADLQVVMGYRYPGNESKAAIEVHPVSGKRNTGAAQRAGLSASPIPTLLVEGDNKPGLGYAIAKALGEANINLAFLLAQVIGRRYSAILAFENEADANKASALIKKAAPPSRRKR